MSRLPAMLWAVDDDAPGGISALPSGPFLLPALLLAGVWAVLLRILLIDWKRHQAVWAPCPTGVDRSKYLSARRNYKAAFAAYHADPNFETYDRLFHASNPAWAPDDWQWILSVPAREVAKFERLG